MTDERDVTPHRERDRYSEPVEAKQDCNRMPRVAVGRVVTSHLSCPSDGGPSCANGVRPWLEDVPEFLSASAMFRPLVDPTATCKTGVVAPIRLEASRTTAKSCVLMRKGFAGA